MKFDNKIELRLEVIDISLVHLLKNEDSQKLLICICYNLTVFNFLLSGFTKRSYESCGPNAPKRDSFDHVM